MLLFHAGSKWAAAEDLLTNPLSSMVLVHERERTEGDKCYERNGDQNEIVAASIPDMCEDTAGENIEERVAVKDFF